MTCPLKNGAECTSDCAFAIIATIKKPAKFYGYDTEEVTKCGLRNFVDEVTKKLDSIDNAIRYINS